MFMTRISDEPGNTARGPIDSANKSFLPDLTLKESNMQKSYASATMGPLEKASNSSTRNRIFKTAHTASKRGSSNAGDQLNSPSRYRFGMIPTENLKFGQFLDIIFNSRLTIDEIKQETRDYVQVLETNYTEKISSIKM